ncbi:hypothetical protein ACFPL7_13310 [Dongia soli]|uniref:Uncharacterized protein n=1 Tax=Dongia soli TaxID=600628 RepID=A0ABU5EF29_9PROT|nr:hypothetical protein [Dongia soli]MDY0884956.1 hypothetical protein [Dongia soli]
MKLWLFSIFAVALLAVLYGAGLSWLEAVPGALLFTLSMWGMERFFWPQFKACNPDSERQEPGSNKK